MVRDRTLLTGSIGNLGHKNQNEEPYLGSRGSAVQGGETAIRLESGAVYSRGVRAQLA